MITRTLKAFAIAGAFAGATLATAYAYQTPIEYQLNSAVIGGQGDGFDRLVFSHRDQMETSGREVTFVVLLQAGADYRLAARSPPTAAVTPFRASTSAPLTAAPMR